MKLSEVELFSHETSFVIKFTHPVSVCRRLFPFGVGTCFLTLNGGVNTADMVIPVKNPTNIQNIENIVIDFIYH
jgi:hypothetical protein